MIPHVEVWILSFHRQANCDSLYTGQLNCQFAGRYQKFRIFLLFTLIYVFILLCKLYCFNAFLETIYLYSYTKRTRAGSSCSKHARNRANRIVRFDKLDDLVSSAPVAVRGIVGSGEGVILPVKWRLTRGGTITTTTLKVVAVDSMSNR
jgi:hypothetical protein